jgi:hypothetical protein
MALLLPEYMPATSRAASRIVSMNAWQIYPEPDLNDIPNWLVLTPAYSKYCSLDVDIVVVQKY